MKRLIAKLAAGAMLVALPLAALAHDDRRHGGRGDYDRHGYHPGHGWKHGHARQYVYHPAPVYHTRQITRIVERPVYVPAPVVRPYPHPVPANSVDIGFRIFF